MDRDQPPPPPRVPRKVKFVPKPSPRRPQIPPPKIDNAEVEDDGNNPAMKHFLSRSERPTRQQTKPENKSPSQVAFSHGVGSTSSIRTFGNQKEKADGGKGATSSIEIIDAIQIDDTEEASSKETLDEYDMQKLVTSMSTDAENDKKKKTGYEGPWDLNSNYPTTLPLRRPYSGDPELLDKAEFEVPPNYDENAVSSASALGLDNDDNERRMLFFQLPKLPLGSSHSSKASKGKEMAGSSINQDRGCNLQELPAGGYMGKMVVYKSGAVKWQMGDVVFDVSPGIDCNFHQNFAAINTEEKHCCVLGELNERAVLVTPEFDPLLDNEN
ncbi:hypothetical protein CASFOL_010363 [Castilleja foliolosa]|uniref:RNA polymerase III RPC4 n=1 Tax=Castilleja foliolosa TaxID=1961234 RepID=A0ABD3DSV7_9LAMI